MSNIARRIFDSDTPPPPKITLATDDDKNDLNKYHRMVRELNFPKTMIYANIAEDINNRKYRTRTKESYSLVSEYYSNPLFTTPIDGNLLTPYSIPAKLTLKQKMPDKSTPVPLYEPFGDPLLTSVSTIVQMIDMSYQSLEFEIASDDDVLNIYARLNRYINWAKSVPGMHRNKEACLFIDKAVGFSKQLTEVRNRICKRRGMPYGPDSFEVLLFKLSL